MQGEYQNMLQPDYEQIIRCNQCLFLNGGSFICFDGGMAVARDFYLAIYF